MTLLLIFVILNNGENADNSCELLRELELVLSVLIPFILFIFGYFTSKAIERWKERRKLGNIKNCLLSHLRDEILPSLVQLKNEYQICEKKADEYEDGSFTVSVYETFNDDVYKANNPADYYKIFYNKNENNYIRLISIYSIIKFLSENLPSKMFDHFFYEIRTDIDNRKGNESNKEHFFNCPKCKSIRDLYKKNVLKRIEEINELEKYIKILIKE